MRKLNKNNSQSLFKVEDGLSWLEAGYVGEGGGDNLESGDT